MWLVKANNASERNEFFQSTMLRICIRIQPRRNNAFKDIPGWKGTSASIL
jgi:hypothetical protein